MKRTLIFIAVMLAGLVINGYSTLPVVDYSHIAQDAGNEIVNFVKWASTEVSAAQTELNTLNSYEQQVLQVARMGDPASLRALPGVQNIATLEQIYGQVEKDYADINKLANPANAQNNLNSILGNYKLPAWNGVQNGSVQFQPLQGNYQFPVSDFNVAQTVQQKLRTLTQKLTTLNQQRDQALSQMQSASDQSTVQKLNGVISALSGAIEDVHQQQQQVMNQGTLQQTQNAAAKQIYQQTQKEQAGASFQQGVNGALDTMGNAGANFGTTPRWSAIQP